jgi:uncharacterized protein YqgC (DUF456 family)
MFLVCFSLLLDPYPGRVVAEKLVFRSFFENARTHRGRLIGLVTLTNLVYSQES